jgi:hypothetical protein
MCLLCPKKITANDLCLWRLRFPKRVSVPDTETKLRNVPDIGNGPPAADINTLLCTGRQVNRYF